MPEATPSKRGPRTPEGKARSALNALRHGLRARRFLVLPDEDPAEFAAFAASVRATYAPADPVEAHLVEGVAVAMWRELRADRVEAETMADVPPADEGRSCGTDLVGRPEHRAGLEAALRYRSQAQLELRRALNLLLRHREARDRMGRVPARPEAAAEPAGADEAEICTNEFPPAGETPARVGLRQAVRRRLNPLDDPLLRRPGRDPDLVLPVPGLHPGVWPLMQRHADPGPWPAGGPQPYRRVPGLPADEWHRSQHLLPDTAAGDPGGDGPLTRPAAA